MQTVNAHAGGADVGLGVAILLLACNAIGFEILDSTDEEWVAPGFEVVEEAVIDPLEYGEPFSNDGDPSVGVHLSFVASDSSEVWRVVFVLDRKVVVLEEGSDPVEIPVDLGIESCAFSPSGRFVVVHDGAEEYTGWNAARIDTETGEAEIFDSQPGGQPGPRSIVVSNIGSVLCGWTFFDEHLDSIGRGADLQNPGAPVVSSDGSYWAVAEGYGWSIHLLDRTGAEIWSRSSSGTLADRMVFSPDETLLAVPLCSGLEIWDTETGETIWRDDSDRIGSTPTFDPSANSFWFGRCGYDLPSALQNGDACITIAGYDGKYRHWRVIAASPEILLIELESQNPSLRRRAVINLDGEVVWMSSASERSYPGPLSATGRTFRYSVNSLRFGLSSSGELVGLAPGEAIRFLDIREVD